MKISELLIEGRNELIENKIEDANIIAKVLIQYILKLERNQLIIKQTEEVEEKEENAYKEQIKRIINGVPLQYIINSQEFMKLNFYVNEKVLIPQPDTEILVEKVIEIATKEKKEKILDLCSGSRMYRNITCKIFRKG